MSSFENIHLKLDVWKTNIAKVIARKSESKMSFSLDSLKLNETLWIQFAQCSKFLTSVSNNKYQTNFHFATISIHSHLFSRPELCYLQSEISDNTFFSRSWLNRLFFSRISVFGIYSIIGFYQCAMHYAGPKYFKSFFSFSK